MKRTFFGVLVVTVSIATSGLAGIQSAHAGKPTGGNAPGTAVAAPCGGVAPPKPGGGTYTCTFADEFDGRSLDSSKWVVQNTATTGFYMGETCFKNDGSNIRVRDGQLKLSVTQSSQPFTCKTPVGEFQTRYLGADISTWGRFQQTNGRFEARIRFGEMTGAGIHSGFWMNPKDKKYGGWPHSGEIDVAEWFSSRPEYAHPSLHYAGRHWSEDTGWDCRIGRPDVFHTVAVEWDTTVMRFIYDGQVCWSRSWSPLAPLTAPAPFDQDFFLSLTQGVGGPPTNQPGVDTGFPATLTVDHVRVWS